MKVCNTCKKEYNGTSLAECRSCSRIRNVRKNSLTFLKNTYSYIKNRCKNKYKATTSKYYYGKEYCSKEEFLNKFKNNKQFLDLFRRWQDSNFEYKEIPSINRLDNNKGYLPDNLEFITHSKNAGIDKEKLPILMYDMDGNFIREYESKWRAHLELGIPNGNLVKCCYGERKSAGGYIWKFKNA